MEPEPEEAASKSLSSNLWCIEWSSERLTWLVALAVADHPHRVCDHVLVESEKTDIREPPNQKDMADLCPIMALNHNTNRIST